MVPPIAPAPTMVMFTDPSLRSDSQQWVAGIHGERGHEEHDLTTGHRCEALQLIAKIVGDAADRLSLAHGLADLHVRMEETILLRPHPGERVVDALTGMDGLVTGKHPQ